MIAKNDKKITTAWAFYDWANSVYALVITAAIFPIYWGNITNLFGKNKILIWGLEPNAIFDFSLMLSFSIVLILSPILSSIADHSGNKLKFMKRFCYLGGFSCMGLYFFTDLSTAWVGLLFSTLASIGFWGSLVFYNAYLPEIASIEKQNNLSAKGFIFGYIGSITLLVICLVLIMVVAPENQKGLYTRISFVLTGIWWMGFAQYSFAVLPKNANDNKIKPDDLLKTSFISIIKTGKKLISDTTIKKYLVSFFFFSLGMQTIFLMATLFGQSELHLDTSKLILTILGIQFIAIFGAWFFSLLAIKIGDFLALGLGVFIWIIVCCLGYTINSQSKNAELEFYFIACLVGLVMGGIQSLARSTFSKLLPKTNDYTTYFSFYDVLEKLALVIGLATYGLLIQYTGGMKTSTLAMGFSFFVSLIILLNLSFSKQK
jgi:MFS transporter, UMF1 family